jgi:sarcosine oxidase subunit gamma
MIRRERGWMADRLAPRGRPAIVASPMVSLAAPAGRLLLRGDPPAMVLAGEALSLAISTQACRAVTGETGAALWLGPDEQLLLVSETEVPNLLATLALALAGARHGLVDISHRQVAIIVSGPGVEALMNTVCPLDLDLSAFPVGMCARTLLAKAEIILWRTEELTFHLEVWRSFAAYVTGLLAEASLEFHGSEP